MKKLVIWLAIILIAVVLGFRGIPFLVNLYLNDNAERIVSNMITRTSGFAEHKVEFGNIRLDYNYFGTFLEIEDIRISPQDTSDKLDLRVNLSAKKASISGFTWTSFLMGNSITIDSAMLMELNIISISPPLDSIEVSGSKAPKGKDRDYESIRVKHFELNQMALENRDSYTDSVRLQLKDLTVHAEGFELTKEDIRSSEKLFKVDVIKGNIGAARVHFDEYRQFASVDKLSFNTEEGGMEIENFSLIHKLDRYAYTNLFEMRKSWIEILDSRLSIQGMNFDSYFRKGLLEMDSLAAEGLKLTVFVDRRKTEDLEKRPPMIHEMLNNMGQIIHIQRAIINNGYVRIEERPDNNAPKPGFVFFSELDAQISNISNDRERLAADGEMKMDATANLMGVGVINAHLAYMLTSEDGSFHISGTLGQMELREVNSMVESEAKVRLKSGKVNQLDFNIHGNDYEGNGEVIVRYDNLEIEILDKNFQSDQNIIRKIDSFIANTFVIKSNNPTKAGELKKGAVYFLREPHKPIFNYWWNLILSGLKSTISGESLEELKQSEKEKDVVSKRDLRKEERKQKRLAKAAN